MRPLRAMEKEGLEVTVIPCSPEGFLNPQEVRKVIKRATRMVILNHGSNVVGTLQPLFEVGEVCQKNGIFFFVDAAQTAGAVPLNMVEQQIDLLAFTGHKALFGPQGTGGLVIGERVEEKKIIPIKRGGTGSRSEFEEQPDFLPDLCESGTPNTVGLAGLLAGLEFVLNEGLNKIRDREIHLTEILLKNLQGIPKVLVYGPQKKENQIGTVSFNIQGMSPSEVGERLDEQFNILCRVGLHCSPSAHRTIGTFPQGTIRFSMSYLNTEKEIEKAILAVKQLAREVG